MKKWIVLAISALLAVGLLTACGTDKTAEEMSSSKVKVAVTFDAMREFVHAVGKDKVEIVNMIPDGTEPHGFEPTIKTLKELQSSRLLVYNGLGMEPWVEKTVQTVGNKNLIMVEASKGITPIPLTAAEKVQEHGDYDPHSWLSLENAQIEVKHIADALAEADPDNADFYQKNAKDYTAQLQQMEEDYAHKFQALPNKQFVTGHAAFAYLCRDMGLQQNSVESVFADGEPSTQQLVRLTEYCRQHHVKTIFVEDMVSPKTSQTLADEVGASVKQIHTLEASEDGASYLDRMKENLDEIYSSLQ
jgi:zinc transport system substrate-binding protein